MTDMVESVARAIYVQMRLAGQERGNEAHLSAVFGPDKRDWYQRYGIDARAAARAAIEAMRKPSEAMIAHGWAALDGGLPEAFERSYEAAIDAALSQSGDSPSLRGGV